MSSASESSTPPSHGLPDPPGESKLEMTPTEVLSMIFNHLSQNDLQSFLDLQDKALVEANRAAHRNMRSLCLTSKRVDRVTRPLLFQNITITSPANLLMLYQSLHESPQLGCHVKQLSFEILLGKVRPCDFLPLPSSRCANLLTDWDEDTRPASSVERSSPRNSEQYSTYCCDQILSCCYFEILRRTPRIHRLVLRLQPARDRLSKGDSNKIFYPKFMCNSLFKKVNLATDQSITGDGTEFLSELKTFQILGDPEDPRNMLHIGTWEPLLRLPTLQYFACSQVWGFIYPEMFKGPDNPGPVPIFNSIKMVEFQDCPYLMAGFQDLGVLFPGLESLKICMRIHNVWSIKGHHGCDLFGELQKALAPMKNLHSLVLEFRYDGTRPYSHVVSMPLCKLALASLPKLATITIPLQLLVEEHTVSCLMMDDHLANTLPKSMRYLILTVQVRCHSHWHGDKGETSSSSTCTPSSTIIDFMEALSRLGHGMFPHLEEVVCCYSMKGYKVWPGFETVETVSTNLEETDLLGLDEESFQRLEQLRASIRFQKVRFSVAYENLECLHDYDTDFDRE